LDQAEAVAATARTAATEYFILTVLMVLFTVKVIESDF